MAVPIGMLPPHAHRIVSPGVLPRSTTPVTSPRSAASSQYRNVATRSSSTAFRGGTSLPLLWPLMPAFSSSRLQALRESRCLFGRYRSIRGDAHRLTGPFRTRLDFVGLGLPGVVELSAKAGCVQTEALEVGRQSRRQALPLGSQESGDRIEPLPQGRSDLPQSRQGHRRDG